MSNRIEDHMCERTLLAGIRRGDRGCQEQFVRNYGPCVLATARRYMNDEDDSDDVFQEAFINVLNGLNGFEGRSTLGYWVRCVTARTALMQLRKRKKRAEVSLEAWQEETLPEYGGLPTDQVHSSEQQAQADEISSHVRSAVAGLRESYRTMIVLRDFLGASNKEAADTLGMEFGSAAVRLHRARAALGKSLRKQFQSHELV